MVAEHSFTPDVCRIRLIKDKDPTGVAGTGVVAVGGVLPSGAAFLEFQNRSNKHLSTNNNGFSYHPGEDGLEDLIEIRCRDEHTRIEFVDDVEDEVDELPSESESETTEASS